MEAKSPWTPPLRGAAVNLGSLLLDNIPATLVLAILYIICASFAGLRLFGKLCAKDRPESCHRSYLVACWLSLLLRSCSFLAISILAIRTKLRTDVLETLVGTCLGFGDWLALSAFLLGIRRYIGIVYSLRHHLFNTKFQERLWRGLLITFILVLLLTAIGLYTAVFVRNAGPGSSLFGSIQLALSITNLSVAGVFLISWLSYGLLLSGFPYRTPQGAQLAKTSRQLVLLWTVTRLLVSSCEFIFSSQTTINGLSDVGSWFFPCLLSVLFISCDLLPSLLSFLAPWFEIFLGSPSSSVAPEAAEAAEHQISPRELLLSLNDTEAESHGSAAEGRSGEEGMPTDREPLHSSVDGFQTARSVENANARSAYRVLSGFWQRWAGGTGGAGGMRPPGIAEDGESSASASSTQHRARPPQPSIPELF
jgi:hypothetical protein